MQALAAEPAPERIETFSARALGSSLRLQVRLPGSPLDAVGDAWAGDAAGAAWDEVRSEFVAVDLALSRFRADSELCALNRTAGTGNVVRVSRRLREALAAMHRAGRITGGRFDPSVTDVLERLGEHGASQGSDVPMPAFELEGPRLVRAPATPLDTGGIGKGLALRWAARRASGVLPLDAGFLLDAGGDIVAAGEPPAGGWRVGIEDPVAADGADDAEAEPIAVIALFDGAIATSSVKVRNWTSPDGRAVHHLVDPRTREPARTGLIAVTVAGPDPAWAEVWTKALFLAGRSEIGAEARSRGLAAWWIADDGSIGMTPAGRERSVWAAETRLG